MERTDFAPNFQWGAATAAFQVEGATAEDGRGQSIWDKFTRQSGAIVDGQTAEVASDQYHRVEEDVALMADLGLNAYRFSIAWPRIQPSGSGKVNRSGIDFYRRLAESLHERGIAPWATLYHWDLPQALEDRGGWIERDTAFRFADYASLVAEELGDVITHWITLNEPWCSAFLGYANGNHAPGLRLGSRSAHAAHHLLLGHGNALAAIRTVQPDSQVGIALNLYSVRPATSSDDDIDAARRIDGLCNRLFLEPVLTGSYPSDVLADMGESQWFDENATAADLEAISAPIDFLGVNYYSRHTVAAGDTHNEASAYPGSETVQFVDTGAPKTQMGWEIHPDGLVDVLEEANAYAPELPLYVTENGSAYEDIVSEDGAIHDHERTEYLRSHIEACGVAIGRRVPLRGYFIWSLIDNFEWAWGYTRRFGLVFVDYATQARIPKASARWLTQFLKGS